MRRSISTNRPDSGRFDQSELAVTWKKISWPSPRLAAVTSGVPSFRRAHTLTSGSEPRRIGQHLLVDQHLGRRRQAGEQAVVAERRQRLRRCPGQGAAQRASAEPQRHGQQIVAALLQPRAGEAHEHAALLHPLLDPLLDVVRQRADVGQHQRGDVALDEAVDDGGQIGVVALGDLRERQQRALDVIERRQQRLRLLARGTRDAGRRGAIASGHRAGARRRRSARRRSRRASPGSAARAACRRWRARASRRRRARRLPRPGAGRAPTWRAACRRAGRLRRAAPAHRGVRLWPRRPRRRAPPDRAASPPPRACRRRGRRASRQSRAPCRRGRCRRRATRSTAGPAPASAVAIACAVAMRSGANGCGCTAAAVERAAAGASTFRLMALVALAVGAISSGRLWPSASAIRRSIM